MRQETKVRGPAYGAYVDVDVDRYLGGCSRRSRCRGGSTCSRVHARRHPVLAAGYDSELWFTLGAAAGVKGYLAPHIGVRFEAAAITRLSSSAEWASAAATAASSATRAPVRSRRPGGGMFIAF